VRQAISVFHARVTDNGSRKVRYIAEPGRYFVSRSTTIATKIYGRKGGKGNSQALYIDDGVYGSFNNVVYDHYHPVPLTLKSSIETTDEECETAALRIPTAVFGPTCDGLD
jgi:ornithine decarboxylase